MTASTNASATGFGRLPNQAASISFIRAVSFARCSCSNFECLAMALSDPGCEKAARTGVRAASLTLGQALVTFVARGPLGLASISNSTFSPPVSRSKSRDDVSELRWKK